MRRRARRPSPSPSPAVAVAALYFGVLAGTSLNDLLGLDRPLWAAYEVDGTDTSEARHPAVVEVFASWVIRRAPAAAGASTAEEAMCERLVMLGVSEDELAACPARLRCRTAPLH